MTEAVQAEATAAVAPASAAAAGETPGARVLRRLFRRPPAVIAMAVVAVFIAIAVAAPHVAPHDPV